MVSEASSDKEEILVVECDPGESEDTRRKWPFLRDRRIDAYGPFSIAGSANNRIGAKTNESPQNLRRLPSISATGCRRKGEPHATWLGWPHEQTTARQIPNSAVGLRRNRPPLSRVERVYLLVQIAPPNSRSAPC